MRYLKYYYNERNHALLLMLAVLIYSSIITEAEAGNYYKGQTIFSTYCQGCHGSDGKGAISGAPNFTRGPSLMKPDASLLEIVINGKNAMPGFQGILKNEDVYDVISYVRTFH